MPRTNTMRITGLLILVAAYAMHQRGLFIAYHLFRVITLMRGH
jgi:hypothetical protein